MPESADQDPLNNLLDQLRQIASDWEVNARGWRSIADKPNDESHRQDCLRREEVLVACASTLRGIVEDWAPRGQRLI